MGHQGQHWVSCLSTIPGIDMENVRGPRVPQDREDMSDGGSLRIQEWAHRPFIDTLDNHVSGSCEITGVEQMQTVIEM